MQRELRSVTRRCRAVLVGMALLAQPAVAGAHGASHVRAVAGPLPAPLAGMEVEVHYSVAPQLVLENTTGRTVEVLDVDGTAFIRIGPRGVEANLAAPATYATQGPGAPLAVAARDDAAARWTLVRTQPSYGWFDPRLDPGDVHVARFSQAVTTGTWTIPLRVDGDDVLLAGTFEWTPPPAPAALSLTSPAEIAPGVRIRMLPGRHPGLLVENAGTRSVTILGVDGEPFLRIGQAGVEANVRSATWQQSGRATIVDATPAREPAWVRVATGTRYGWVDPRLAAPALGSGSLEQWRIPLLIGTEPAVVTGERAWRTPSRTR